MDDARPIFVLTEVDDPTADLVIAELGRRDIPVVRLDPGDFPRQIAFTAVMGDGRMWSGGLQTSTRDTPLAARALYYRRPSPYTFPSLDEQDARYAAAQAEHGLGGVLATLTDCLYVNHPERNRAAEYKPGQLATAAKLGLKVPTTLITNNPVAARSFALTHGPVVHKTLRMLPYAIDGEPHTVRTEEISPDEIDDSVSGTAHLFQARVNKVADVRVAVIGADAFYVRIDSGLLDWRQDYKAHSYSVIDPPVGLTDRLQEFTALYGLVFATFDFALERNGDWLFFECNPNGQWAWMEEPTGLPMTTAIADLLERGVQ